MAERIRLVAMAGALREGSLNKKLLRIAVAIAREAGADVEGVDLRELAIPFYDGDLEDREGLPEGARVLTERIAGADGFVIASPEYNFSVPAVVKNAIDWLSRAKPQPWRGKCGLLLSASPSLVGGNRSLWTLRVPLESLGAHLLPEMFSLAQAHEAFDAGGALRDPAAEKRLRATVGRFLDLTRSLSKRS
jgi:NAD(P)H-dependent FMN reductase